MYSKFEWNCLLDNKYFTAAPVTNFPHAPGYNLWKTVTTPMFIEIENKDQMSFWYGRVIKVQGYKAKIRPCGPDAHDDQHDFWSNLCGDTIHVVGWCFARGLRLHSPFTNFWTTPRLEGTWIQPSKYNAERDLLPRRQNMELGKHVEVVDHNFVRQMRLATVVTVVGRLLSMRYWDALPTDSDIWCHEESELVHELGWSKAVGHAISMPCGSVGEIFVEENDETNEGKFHEGMQLEALFPLNPDEICPATVINVLKRGFIMIQLDCFYENNEEIYNPFCVHESSRLIFPVGFAQTHGMAIKPTWRTSTYSNEAPEENFNHISETNAFKVGMYLEVADVLIPRELWIGKVVKKAGNLLKIHYPTWSRSADIWVDAKATNIFPCGFSEIVGLAVRIN